jgi:hypothetical protein
MVPGAKKRAAVSPYSINPYNFVAVFITEKLLVILPDPAGPEPYSLCSRRFFIDSLYL